MSYKDLINARFLAPFDIFREHLEGFLQVKLASSQETKVVVCVILAQVAVPVVRIPSSQFNLEPHQRPRLILSQTTPIAILLFVRHPHLDVIWF